MSLSKGNTERNVENPQHTRWRSIAYHSLNGLWVVGAERPWQVFRDSWCICREIRNLRLTALNRLSLFLLDQQPESFFLPSSRPSVICSERITLFWTLRAPSMALAGSSVCSALYRTCCISPFPQHWLAFSISSGASHTLAHHSHSIHHNWILNECW